MSAVKRKHRIEFRSDGERIRHNIMWTPDEAWRVVGFEVLTSCDLSEAWVNGVFVRDKNQVLQPVPLVVLMATQLILPLVLPGTELRLDLVGLPIGDYSIMPIGHAVHNGVITRIEDEVVPT